MDQGERLDALEFKLAHLERSLQELSDVVIRQQQELGQLSMRIRQLLGQLENLGQEAEEKKDPYEIPPHY